MRKPLIGVLPLYDREKESYWMLPGYMKGIEEAGGIPVMLPLTTDRDIISTLADTYDGFLFTGGHDLNPELYGETVTAVCGELCRDRDVLEMALFEHVLSRDKPALGICRGLQLFNVALGGTLYQDLPTGRKTDHPLEHRQKPPYTTPVHNVYIKKESRLYSILGTETLPVNSYHHQGIKKLAERLLAVAKAEDGLVEAVVMPEKKFVLAVQWHPEYMYPAAPVHIKLFEAFVDACER